MEAQPATQPAKPEPPTPSPALASSWQKELGERLEDFRRRRVRLKGEQEEDDNLKFDFETGEPIREIPPDHVIELPGAQQEAVPTEPVGEVNLSQGPDVREEVPPVEPMSIEEDFEALPEARSPLEQDPLEITLEPTSQIEADTSAQVGPYPWPVAPLASRFLAFLADALILIVAGGLFGLIFTIFAHGRLTLTPVNAAVLGIIAASFILLYFAGFVAFTYSTAGLLWKGLEVRTFNGRYPSARDALLRATGYLISASALMLGFVWAAVDSERLSWHDRVSRTYITDIREAPDGEG